MSEATGDKIEISKAISNLSDLIACKGVSDSGEGIQESVQFLKQFLRSHLNAEVTIVKAENDGNPIILATVKGIKKDAIMFYGHYDVMDPGDLNKWDSDPFKLTRRNGKLYARGAGDNRGQLMASIQGVEQYLNSIEGMPPQTIMFFIEGEEEQGSRNLFATVAKHTDKLKNVELVLAVDGSISSSGKHVLRLGCRGLLGFHVQIQTGSHSNHSGNTGNIMSNAFIEFQKILNQIYDFDTDKVLLPHFYDGVKEPTTQQMDWIDKLPFNVEKINKSNGFKMKAMTKQDYYANLMFRPTFNVSGIMSGYTGQGVKTIVPNQLTAKVDFRLVGEQNVTEIEKDIKQLFKPYVDSGLLTFTFYHQIPPSTSEINLDTIHLLQKSVKNIGEDLVVEPIMPGAVPNYVWTELIHKPVITLPLANFDQNNHSFNENISVKAYESGINIVSATTQALSERG